VKIVFTREGLLESINNLSVTIRIDVGVRIRFLGIFKRVDNLGQVEATPHDFHKFRNRLISNFSGIIHSLSYFLPNSLDIDTLYVYILHASRAIAILPWFHLVHHHLFLPFQVVRHVRLRIRRLEVLSLGNYIVL
jgi:hypothetical protein